jgi:mannose-1-phosphate guanylyltransferase
VLPFMKAFLLAAGHGTRLRPLTDTIPKCLVPIRGVPLLQIWLDFCRCHGIDQILINVHAHSGAVRAFLQESGNEDLEVTVSEEKVLLGSAGTLLANRNWLGSDPSFWVFYADVLTTANLVPLREIHERNATHLASLGVYEVPDPRRCGIVSLDEHGVVRDFEEKPEKPRGRLAFSGLMIARRGLLDLIPTEGLPDIGFHVLPKLVGRMSAIPITDYLLDIGTMENYKLAQKTWPGVQSSPS